MKKFIRNFTVIVAFVLLFVMSCFVFYIAFLRIFIFVLSVTDNFDFLFSLLDEDLVVSMIFLLYFFFFFTYKLIIFGVSLYFTIQIYKYYKYQKSYGAFFYALFTIFLLGSFSGMAQLFFKNIDILSDNFFVITFIFSTFTAFIASKIDSKNFKI